MLKKDIVALVLAGGIVKELGVLLKRRSKAALPFGGLYRIIDFPLTNLSVSNIPVVGILSQYRPSSLMDHVGVGRPWDYNQRTRELLFLPPQQGMGPSDWYKGTADAVYQNIPFLERYMPQDVMILAGDHVYSMDYAPFIKFHREMDADLTMVFKPMEVKSPCRFGIGVLDDDHRLIDYEEKPGHPKSNLASLTIYIFKYKVLLEEIIYNSKNGKKFQLYSEVIPHMLESNKKVFGYIFDGAWKYLRTMNEYYEEHIMLAKGLSDLTLDRGIITNLEVQGVGDAPASLVEGDVSNAFISPGSHIMGSVKNSVLGPWVRVHHGAVVQDSIIMGNVEISEGSIIRRAILDKGVRVGKNSVIDGKDGLAVVGWKKTILEGSVLGKGEWQ